MYRYFGEASQHGVGKSNSRASRSMTTPGQGLTNRRAKQAHLGDRPCRQRDVALGVEAPVEGLQLPGSKLTQGGAHLREDAKVVHPQRPKPAHEDDCVVPVTSLHWSNVVIIW